MYSYLDGTLVEKSPTAITLDVHGVGFHLMIPLSTAQRLPKTGEHAKILVHHLVREDAEFLFGFATEEERAFFRLLIGVSGIGAKLAIVLLSGLELSELKRAIVQGSVPALTSISGIGRKTAERLTIELREKIVIDSYAAEVKPSSADHKGEELVEDSLRALVSLGYSKQNAKVAIQKVLAKAEKSGLNPELLIRESLKNI